ncbi:MULTISPECIES: methionine ABC transporter ATP-binding protein [Paenibacillus]|uniref:ATP-binding cassette domain-containing protein n=1 Tax=Paenibacillus agri TaxID=2744309 RepID=A0A850EY46_9BACL|nr:ATP-binding cassette domain-containing protein [Paenibacillus agri]NUU64407.1 ATP-binding cassette domain-containing protein [Paenibacillus agri]
MITVEGLSKSYNTVQGSIQVLDNIQLNVRKGDIFGIIGFSGAGKSTLIRCLNRLEEPDTGRILIGDEEITALKGAALRKARQKIGMIFQQFNLLDAKTVYQNVAFPLEVGGYDKAHIRTRVREILDLVQLSDKENSYPSQLSGGQKQRVGIARALANDPTVLLSDEATSALDPETTYSILELLKDINRQLGLTILLITHELDVLQHICNQMAVIEKGRIVETGTVDKLFFNPESQTAQRFINIIHQYQSRRFAVEGVGAGI